MQIWEERPRNVSSNEGRRLTRQTRRLTTAPESFATSLSYLPLGRPRDSPLRSSSKFFMIVPDPLSSPPALLPSFTARPLFCLPLVKHRLKAHPQHTGPFCASQGTTIYVKVPPGHCTAWRWLLRGRIWFTSQAR